MKYNNLLIVADENTIENVSVKDFDFENCTGITKIDFTFNNPTNNLRAWVRVLAKSHLVVTIGDWASDKNLQILIDVARKLNIPVIPQSNFKKYVSEKND
jgi:hypothetical protein